MSRKLHYLLCLAALAVWGVMAWAQTNQEKPKRARLPSWENFPSDIFFKDAFQEALSGSRPASLGVRRNTIAKRQSTVTESTETSQGDWAMLVSAETLEDEVKSLQISIDQLVTTPGRFSSGGHQIVRREFSELAVLFAVIAEFDGKVRWKKEAATARDAFARAAANAKVTSIQSFHEAKQRKLDLQELVRGGSISILPSASREATWQNVCDRRPLMERFAICYNERIVIWTANADEFKRAKSEIKREAELLRLFSAILTKEGMADAGDEEYQALCHQLATVAETLLRAIADEDLKAAREAASNIGKSCNQCHEDYRA